MASLLFYPEVCHWGLELHFFLVSNVIGVLNLHKISTFLQWRSIIKIYLQLDTLLNSTLLWYWEGGGRLILLLFRWLFIESTMLLPLHLGMFAGFNCSRHQRYVLNHFFWGVNWGYWKFVMCALTFYQLLVVWYRYVDEWVFNLNILLDSLLGRFC